MNDLATVLEMLKALDNSVSGFDGQLAAIKSAVETLVVAAQTPATPADPGTPVPAPASDKIYSQVDLDAAVSAAVLPLQAQIASLTQALSDAKTAVESQVAQKVESMKSDLLSAYQASQVVETTAETGFINLLQPAPVAAPAAPVEAAPVDATPVDAQA